MDVFKYTIGKPKKWPHKRRDRMEKLRRILVLLLIIIPTALSIYLLFKVNSLQKQIDMLMIDRYGMTYAQMTNTDNIAHAADVDDAKDDINDSEKTEDNNDIDESDIVEEDNLVEDENNKEEDENTDNSSSKEEGKDKKEELETATETETSKQDEDKSGQATDADNEIEDDKSSQQKKIYLTFDDGPSKNTSLILDILKEYDVKATFFVTGKTDAYSKSIYKRIVDEGHSIGLHSFSHRYDEIYASLDNFAKDLNTLSDLVYEATGYRSKFYRFPGGSGNAVSKIDMSTFIRYIDENDYTYFDWNVENGDATGKRLSVEEVYNNVMNGVKRVNNSTILMHDGPDKDTTVEALPSIIEGLLNENYLILPISEETKPVQQIKVSNVVRD